MLAQETKPRQTIIFRIGVGQGVSGRNLLFGHNNSAILRNDLYAHYGDQLVNCENLLFILGGGTTNCQTADHHCWLTDTYWHPLPLFAAIAHTWIQCHVIADGPNLS
jgi:hypothetical protein